MAVLQGGEGGEGLGRGSASEQRALGTEIDTMFELKVAFTVLCNVLVTSY